jgi:hypothetical protein
MSEIRDLTRRQFSVAAAMAILSGVAITISGCGGSSNPAGASGNPPTANGDHVGAISANHGHVATVTSAEVADGKGITLNIKGTATHNHTLTLSDAEIASVGANQRVAKVSSSDSGHDHTVTFN